MCLWVYSHSRFLANDRARKEIDIKARFAEGSPHEAIVVATQVVEAGGISELSAVGDIGWGGNRGPQCHIMRLGQLGWRQVPGTRGI